MCRPMELSADALWAKMSSRAHRATRGRMMTPTASSKVLADRLRETPEQYGWWRAQTSDSWKHRVRVARQEVLAERMATLARV